MNSDTEDRLIDACKDWISAWTPDSGSSLLTAPVYRPNNSTKKALPCFTLDIEASEENLPGTGNMDITIKVSFESPMGGKDAQDELSHKAVFKQLSSAFVDSLGFRTYANHASRPFAPFYIYKTYFTQGGPESTSQKKILVSSCSIRVICVIPATG